MSMWGRWRAIFLRFALPVGAISQWLGGASLLLAAGFAMQSWRFAQGQQHAEATVIENVSSFAPAGGVRYAPRLRFRAADGSLVQVQTMDFSEDGDFVVGDTLKVLYPQGKPQQAIIATPWRAYRGAIQFGVLGVILFDVGLILRLMLRRQLSKRMSATEDDGRSRLQP